MDEQLIGPIAAVLIALAVVTIGHKAVTGNDLASTIASFVGNGGVFVGHVHGHTHEDNYLNSAGFGGIGVNWACIKKSQNEFGGENTYRSEDRVFDFSKQTEIV